MSDQSMARKHIREAYTEGVSSVLREEALKLSQESYDFISQERYLLNIFNSLQDYDPYAFTRSFLTCFYSIIISKYIDWTSLKATSTIALGALLHDIGLLRLPTSFRQRHDKELSLSEKIIYQEHPRLGAEMLQDSKIVNEQVRQIIYQHHELKSGTGYPNSLAGFRIYPPAKIVALAERFSRFVLAGPTLPRQALKELLQNREEVINYDPEVLRALVKGFKL